MMKKITFVLLAVFGLSFVAYAAEVIATQKFYDRERLIETLQADDQEALAAAQELSQAIDEANQAVSDAIQADMDAEAASQAAAADTTDAALAATAEELQKIADETDADALQLVADEINTAEGAAELAAIESEINDTALFVESLTEDQVFALNRALNNAVNSGLVLDIDSEDLVLIADANKLQINAFTQAFEQEARFLLKADKFATKAEESGNEKFLTIGDRMTTKADVQKAKFLGKIDRFADSPSTTASSVAKQEAKASAKAAAKDTSKGVAKAAAKQAAKATAKDTAKGIAKAEAKRSAKAAAKLAAKSG